MRDRFTVLTGLILAAIGVVWILDVPADVVDVPWEWVLPLSIVFIGLLFALARNSGGGGTPPSQFERDDAPRVP